MAAPSLLVALALGAASAQGAAICLEPKWTAGEQVWIKLVTQNYSVSRDGGREAPECVLLRKSTMEYEEKVWEVASGLPVRVSRHFKRYDSTTPSQNKTQKSTLSGRKVEFESKNGVLVCKSFADWERLLRELSDSGATMTGGADWAWLLPPAPVAVGDTWKGRSTEAHGAVHMALSGGETTCELVTVENGIALLRFRKDDEKLRDMVQGFRGEASFSLELGRVVRAFIETGMTWMDGPRKVHLVERATFDLDASKDRKPAKSALVRLQPKWRAGERVFVRLVTTDHATGPGKSDLLNTRTVEYEEKATEVRDGVRLRAQRTFKRFEAKRSFEDAPQTHALAGRTVGFRNATGVLACEEETPDLVLDPMSAGADWTWLLPEARNMVSVGDSWAIVPGMHLSTVHWALVRPGTRCELASVTDRIALLRFSNWEGLDGEAEFSLDAGRFIRGSLEMVINKVGAGSKQRVSFELEILKDGD